MQEQLDWNKILIPYKNAVEELKVKFRNLRSELRSIEEYSPIEFVTGRVKKVSSILDKCKKLDVALEDIEEGIEDIAGIRIMCQFVEDIYTVVDFIRDRDGNDLEIVYEKDYITNFKASGYRSYHIVIRYPIQTAMGCKNILAEIQIRTLAMNFWGTIEHSLRYKYKHNIPEHINERLIKASDAAFVLDKEMSEIRHEVRQAQKMFEMKSNTISNILRNIHSIYLAGMVKEATEYQEQFNELWVKGNIRELRKLATKINKFTENHESYE